MNPLDEYIPMVEEMKAMMRGDDMKDKSILLIDTPANCDECDICYPRVAEDGERMEFCPMIGWMKIEIAKEGIHSDCPLKKLPQTRPCNYYDFEHYTSGYDKGWNDCIEYISPKKEEKKNDTNDNG